MKDLARFDCHLSGCRLTTERTPTHHTDKKIDRRTTKSILEIIIHIKISFRIALLNFIIIKSDGLHLREKSSSV